MDINKAKQQVKDTIEAYLATDDQGRRCWTFPASAPSSWWARRALARPLS